MAMSGILTANWNSEYSTAAWVFRWTAEVKTQGKTTVSWTLKTEGRSSSPTWLDTQCQLTVNGTQYNDWNRRLTGSESSFNNVNRLSGSFDISHGEDGKASFSVKMYGFIYDGIFRTSEKTFSLDVNYPYTKCQAPTSIIISPSIQKPGGKITISWSGEKPGSANPITGYKIQYKIASGEWSSAYSSNTNSKTITLPSSALRGGLIMARVKTIGTVSEYDSEYSSPGGEGRINNLPDAPVVSVDRTLVPSTGGVVNFSITAGAVNDNGQTSSIYYSTSATGTKTNCGLKFSPPVGATTTYYFWTYDGLEYSANYALKLINRNSKPTVSMLIDGVQAESEIATFISGNDGQTESNTYVFGFSYNGQDYTLFTDEAESYNIGDIRKHLSDKLGSLIDNSTYSYNYWVYRNDGIENSDKIQSDIYSLIVPKVTLLNDNNLAAPFSKKVTAILSESKTGEYNTIGFTGATTEGLSLITTNLDWGIKLDKILINNTFYLTPQVSLHKVYPIEIIPSNGKNNPYSLSVFKTYSTQTLGITLVGQTSSEYGLTSQPDLILKYNDSIIEKISNSSSDINTYIYYASGAEIYKYINTGASTINLTLEIQNEFGDSFSKSYLLNLDHSEAAIPYLNQSLDIYPYSNSVKYPSLIYWQYLKEGMPLYCDFSVLAFDAPTFIFEIWNYKNSKKWEALATFTSGEISKTSTTLSKYGDLYFNSYPNHYYIKEKKIFEILEILQDHSVNFRARIITRGQETTYNFFSGSEISIKAHYGAQAYFTKVTFSEPNLITEWTVEDYGFSGNGLVKKIGLNISEYSSNITPQDYPTNENTCTWNNFNGFKSGDIIYEFLHMAPILYTEFSTSTNSSSPVSYSGVFTTSKETSASNYVYTVVYNLVPTISYRKNCLGINTAEPSSQQYEGGVIVIGSYNTQNKIYLKSESNVGIIDLLSGALSDFTINCGDW